MLNMSNLKLHSSTYIDIYSALTDVELELPVIPQGISAGFPSPALDFDDLKIDLNKHLIQHPMATYFGRVKGDSMQGVGIDDGDLIVIDKSIEATDGKIAVCYIDGEYTLKQIKLANNECWLMPANENYKPIKITPENDFLIWGIVKHVIKSF